MKIDPNIAGDYKRRVCGAYIPIGPGDIDAKLAGSDFFVTRKYDGEFAMLFFDGKTCAARNSSGKETADFPALKEAASALATAKLKEAIIAAEIYQDETGGRTRVGDVRSALSDKKKASRIRIAPFDIISIGGKDWKAKHYGETHKKLVSLFGASGSCAPVKAEKAPSKEGVKDLFEQWVTKESGEGLVVHSELPMVYKIKPRCTVDAAVVGFSEGEKGEVRSLLYALMLPSGEFQIFAHGGGGLDAKTKKDLYAKLSTETAESNYISTDSNHVAFRMVKPSLVAELSASDIVGENSGGIIRNPRLVFEKGAYAAAGSFPGVSLVNQTFERLREDKSVNKDDVRIAQIEGFIAETKTGGEEKLAASKLLRREVYTKEQGGKFMALKFLLWKTNKENSGVYPAYVFSFTNFSSERAEPLQTDLRISDDKKQIEGIWAEFIEKNVKKGWKKEG
jgi:ATP-dependent DNA ligase